MRERDPDAVAAGAGAENLGELAGQPLARQDSVDGRDDAADYWRFTLGKTQAVTLSLRRQDANAGSLPRGRGRPHPVPRFSQTVVATLTFVRGDDGGLRFLPGRLRSSR